MMANLQINNYANANAISIPSNVIQENAIGEKYVYVITHQEGNNATVKRTQIETGRKSDGFVEITNGLTAGDVIVKEGALTLKDGATITIKQEN